MSDCRDEIEGANEDAARYRWLRRHHMTPGPSWHVREPSNEVAICDLDAAIDLAMSAERYRITPAGREHLDGKA